MIDLGGLPGALHMLYIDDRDSLCLHQCVASTQLCVLVNCFIHSTQNAPGGVIAVELETVSSEGMMSLEPYMLHPRAVERETASLWKTPNVPLCLLLIPR